MHLVDPDLERFLIWVEHLLGFTLHDYQKNAIRFLWENPKSALFADVGLGKAIMALVVIYRALYGLDTGLALVIAPIRVAKQTWPTEIHDWQLDLPYTLIRAEDGDEDVKAVFDDHRMRFLQAAKILDVPVKDRNRQASQFAAGFREAYKQDKRRRLADSKTPLHIIGLPQVEWLVQHHGKNWPYKTVVIDESSAFKDYSTKRWKAIHAVRKMVDRIHLLTASPAAETWLDLWAQVGLLDQGERLGRRITWYRENYFKHNEYERSYTLMHGAEERISEKISDICLVMKAEDHLDLAKPLMLTRPIELAPHVIDLYDDFMTNYVLSLPEKDIEAVSGGVLINKLLQFTGGAVLDEDRNMHEVHDDKIDELRELIAELQGEPLMVAYWYKSSLKRLQKAFPKATTMDRAGKCIDDWNSGNIPLLFIHPACLHPSTEVLTEHRGWRMIVDVKRGERVHDGVEFVGHSGCWFSGVKSVVDVFGVKMTRNHKLLIGGKWVEAQHVRNTGRTAAEARYTWGREADCPASALSDLRRRTDDGEAERLEVKSREAQALPGLLSSRRAPHGRNTLPFDLAGDGVACDQSRRSGVRKIRGGWPNGVCGVAQVPKLLSRYARHLFRRFDYRPGEQRFRLLERELPVGHEYGSAVQQEQQSRGRIRRLADALGVILSGNRNVARCGGGSPQPRDDRRSSGGRLAGVQLSEEQEVSPVYDLVDCGPRNRFLIRNAEGEMFISHNSAGHGLNLQKGPGHDLAFFDIPWSRELYEQVIGRLARQGQKKVVRVHHLIVRRADDGVKRSKRDVEMRMTADEIVMQALANKGEGQDALFRFIREIRRRVAERAVTVVQQSDSIGDDL